MRARDAVGRRIVAIHQERVRNDTFQCVDYVVRAIELDNGTRLVPFSVPDEYDSYCVVLVVKRDE